MTSPNTLERMAGAIWLARTDKAEKRTAAQWAEYLQWYKDGVGDPESCVHYWTIADALRDAKAALAELKTIDDSTVEAMATAVYRARYGSDEGWPNESEAFKASIADVAKPAFTAAITEILNQGAEG